VDGPSAQTFSRVILDPMSETITKPPLQTSGLTHIACVRLLRQVYPPEACRSHVVGERPVVLGRAPGEGIVVADGEASRRHATLEYDHIRQCHLLRDMGSSNGTFVNGKRITEVELINGSVVRIGRAIFIYASSSLPVGTPPPMLSPGIALARALVEAVADRAAPASLPVLVYGPTGAGKERLARRIHEHSGRTGRIISVNCGALSSELLGSELFGHVRGAFSGAQGPREGLFVAANKGTLFLDEIGELPLDQQPAMLRVLEEGRVRPVGADRDIAVDVRLVAATHRDLDRAVAEKRFRADLLARMRGVTLRLPPLQERRDELLALFSLFIGEVPFGRTVAETLLLYDWPENVREVEHVAAYVRLFAEQAGHVHLSHLPEQFQDPRATTGKTAKVRDTNRASFGNLKTLLEKFEGNISQVASALGVHRQQAYRWIKKANLDPKDFRP